MKVWDPRQLQLLGKVSGALALVENLTLPMFVFYSHILSDFPSVPYLQLSLTRLPFTPAMSLPLGQMPTSSSSSMAATACAPSRNTCAPTRGSRNCTLRGSLPPASLWRYVGSAGCQGAGTWRVRWAQKTSEETESCIQRQMHLSP